MDSGEIQAGGAPPRPPPATGEPSTQGSFIPTVSISRTDASGFAAILAEEARGYLSAAEYAEAGVASRWIMLNQQPPGSA